MTRRPPNKVDSARPQQPKVRPAGASGTPPPYWDGPAADLIDISEIKTTDSLSSALYQTRLGLFMCGGALIALVSQNVVTFWLAFGLTLLALGHGWAVSRFPNMVKQRELRVILITTVFATLTHLVGGVYLWVVDGPSFDMLSLLLLCGSMLNTFIARVGILAMATIEMTAVAIGMVLRVVWMIYLAEPWPSVIAFGAVSVFIFGFYTMICVKYARVRAALRQAQDIQAENAKLMAVGRLTGGVAHDFNNMLTAVLGNLELAKLADGPADRIACIQLAENSARQGAVLTRELLALSGRSHFRIASHNVLPLFEKAAMAVDPPLTGAHRLDRLVEDGVPPMMVDADMLSSALAKILGNARDAMPDGGVIGISAYRSMALNGPTVTLSIEDGGKGISEELRPYVFEPYFTTKPVGQGSGLGLPIARGVVEQLGGRIDINSADIGFGTEVQLHIPVVGEPADASGSPQNAAPANLI